MMETVSHININCLWKSCTLLGESPLWCPKTNRLFFVDIKNPGILSWNDDGTICRYPMPSEIGCIVRGQSKTFFAALREGIAHVNLEPLTVKRLLPLEQNQPGNRFNDGKCDPKGRFWLSSMDNEEVNPSGNIWRISKHLCATHISKGYVVGNGFGWSPDGRTMYFTDSSKRIIYAYPFDIDTGTLGTQQIFAIIPREKGFPDGLTVDCEGYVWSAHWDGSCITRYHPNGGVDCLIPLPIPRPTSLAFGGKNLDRLFVTSASFGLNDNALALAPLSGSLFELNVGICGYEEPICVIME